MESTFTFLRYEFLPEQGSASFFYELQTDTQTHNFKEIIQFPAINTANTKYEILNTVLDNLLLILGISYYKLTCAKTIKTPTIQLTPEQAAFWNTVYTKGLGEFFYKNNIDYRGLIQFPYTTNVIVRNEETKQSQSINKSLLLFGGGKDSIVSGELLKKHNKPFAAFVVNPTKIHEETLKILGCETIIFKREIDPQIFELNKQPGIYNGHVPATAMIDFLAVFAAELYGYHNVIASNEQSANYGNVNYLGQEINHQWSKSLEFEQLFQNYLNENITKDILYFSLLRPLSEIYITKLFTHYTQYFPYFSSCNKNFVIQDSRFKIHDKWCGTCPKCLFVFMLLSAFLPKEKLINIFGKDLYENETLLPTLKALLGITKIKPFECVGTPNESQLAMSLAHKNHSYDSDILMQFLIKEIEPTEDTQLLTKQKIDTIPQGFQDIYETI